MDEREHREHLERLLARLPPSIRSAASRLLRPEAKWVRLPVGVLLIVGGVFGFLPILGFWMIPLGALLLAQDIPALRGPTVRAIGAVQRWWERRRGARPP